MEDAIVLNREEDSRGSYYIEYEGKTIAEMTYSKAGSDRIIIDHTEVSDDFRKQGLGQKMVQKAVEDARNRKISIIPLCPFARSVFLKHEEFDDVL